MRRYEMKPGFSFGFLLLLALLLSFFVATKLVGVSNDVARVSADLASKAHLSTISSPARGNAFFSMSSMGILLSENKNLVAGIVAQIDEKNGNVDDRQVKGFHGSCPLRSQHLSSG
jgi:hypothetical protein